MAPSADKMWDAFVTSDLPWAEAAAESSFSSWHFGTGGEMADELVKLVLEGRKRATAASLWAYELEGETPPAVGDFSVVTDGSGEARCVIRTTSVEVVAFSDVDESFAAAEGEGDLSLRYWREGHWFFFTQELEAWGRDPEPDMPVVCERFELVFPAQTASRSPED